jgi:hypothetical protein
MLKNATKEQIEWLERQLPPCPTRVVLAYAGHHTLKEWKAILPMDDAKYFAMTNDQLEQQIKGIVPSVVAYHVVTIKDEPEKPAA